MLTIILISSAVKISFGDTNKNIQNVYYQPIDIVKNDTLWKIAQEYKVDTMSTPYYVAQIQEVNNMKNDKIKVGQKIIIPVYVQSLE